jgi:hypothetical protein
MTWDVRRQQLTAQALANTDDYLHQWRSWSTPAVFLICIPTGYVIGHRALFLLAVPDWVVWLWRRRPTRSAAQG